MANAALRSLSPEMGALYAKVGRPSIAPERLLRALLLQILHSIRSERLLVEQLDYNFLFRWFVGMGTNEEVWNHSSFTTNRDRLLAGDIARRFFAAVLDQAKAQNLTSDEHFTVDGTLIEAWASMKSVKPKDGSEPPGGSGGRNPSVDFRGKKRRNDTHASTTDPEARMYRKGDGQQSKLCYMGHVLMENRHGLVVDGRLTQATGDAERDAAHEMAQAIPGQGRVTLGGDKAYDTAEFVESLRALSVTPHVAQNTAGRRSAIDGRTTRHPGYAVSLKARKLVEEVFGWIKTVATMRKTRFKGRDRVGWSFIFGLAAYNLVRMRNIASHA
jgi:transposase